MKKHIKHIGSHGKNEHVQLIVAAFYKSTHVDTWTITNSRFLSENKTDLEMIEVLLFTMFGVRLGQAAENYILEHLVDIKVNGYKEIFVYQLKINNCIELLPSSLAELKLLNFNDIKKEIRDRRHAFAVDSTSVIEELTIKKLI